MRRRLVLTALACLSAAAAPGSAHAAAQQESTFQDDPLVVYGTPDQQFQTLERMKAMGADRIRVSLFWQFVAPDNQSTQRPVGFNAKDHTAYAKGWEPYDRIVRFAKQLGVEVNFNITAPAPKWATGDPGDRADLKAVWRPDPKEFGEFAFAAGERYSGKVDNVPRVSYWSIWNEPNQGAWLAPQWVDGGAGAVETSPKLYRELAEASIGALGITGHTTRTDTILLGETAPKGSKDRGPSRPMSPRRFMLRMYCLDDNAQFLRGAAAEQQGCPAEGDPGKAMREQHPALFGITGWAHHPYELTFAPNKKPADPESFTLGNLKDLGKLLQRVYQRMGLPMPGNAKRFPLYLTEFGYQTDPPDPLGVSNANQAAYLNQSEYLTMRNPAVKTLAQFLLVDDGPEQDKFQSGFITMAGKIKPAMAAYRLPVWVSQPRFRKGRTVKVWGFARAGANGTRQKVDVQLRRGRKGAWKRARTVTAEAKRGYFTTTVRPRSSGAVRLSWKDPRSGRTYTSRTVTITRR